MSKPLKRLLLTYELAFLLLLIIAGSVGSLWAYFWQQTSAESVRLGNLQETAQQVKTDLFRQIKEVTWARLKDDPEALELYGVYSRKIDDYFIELRTNANDVGETSAIQQVNQSYRVLQKDMNKIFTDHYMINRVVRLRMMDPAYERNMVGFFEHEFAQLEDLIKSKQTKLENTMEYWTSLAPWIIPVPVLLAIILLLMSRASIQKQVVRPVEVVKKGASLISKGQLDHTIPQQGVSEMVSLAGRINEMAAELAKNRDALIESEKQAALGALVPVVAHNIRNPLASIRANAQLLEHIDSKEDRLEIKNGVIDTVDRLGRWVSALVSYLHPLKPQLRETSLTSLLETVIKLLHPRLEEKQIQIIRDPWDVELSAQADPDLMEQALYGILSNAIDASPVASDITLSVSRKTDHTEISITDQGTGMPFDPKPGDLSPGLTTKRFGTGLGIPVAFKVCNTHGWKLSYHKNMDAMGTCVIIVVPEILQKNFLA